MKRQQGGMKKTGQQQLGLHRSWHMAPAQAVGWVPRPNWPGFWLGVALVLSENGLGQGSGDASTVPSVSYQGRLVDGGRAASGSYDFQFVLTDAASGGQVLGQPISLGLNVQQGVFTTPLAFGAEHFNGAPRWIEVRVRPTPANGAVPESYAVLERQPVHFAPYAIRASTASTVVSVPVQSLPSAVPLKDEQGKLDSSLFGSDIARSVDVASVSQALAQAQATLQSQAVVVGQLQSQVAALVQENAALRQSVETAAAPVRSGWMVASVDPADPALTSAGFSRAFSTPEPAWVFGSTASAPSARVDASGVWTGQEWLVWGGRGAGQVPLATGAGYRPASDAWVELGSSDAPEARSGHTAVWTGTEMIVWGGFASTSLNTGGRFSRNRISWEPVATLNAPTARHGHGAAWTGTVMVLFGGRSVNGLLNDGGLYDPAQDLWTALPTPQAPSARIGATVLWTGSGILVWGGETAEAGDATGAFLPFDANGNPGAWESLPVLPGFVARSGHVAAWDGQRLIVWGGRSMGRQLLSDGAVLDLGNRTWTTLNLNGAPTARYQASGVWTGEELLVFGGQDAGGAASGGHAWRRSSGTWRVLPASNPAVARSAGLAAWTGTELLLFGGQGAAASSPIGQAQRLAASPPWHFFRRSPN